MSDYHIYSGISGTLNVNSGTVYLYGGVVERLNLNDSRFVQNGGIVQRKIIIGCNESTRTPDEYSKTIDILNRRISRLESECLSVRKDCRYWQERAQILANDNNSLREKLDEVKGKNPEANQDDVLVQRICTLRKELEKEREAHKKEVEELNYRLDVAMEVNADLRHRLDDHDKISQEIAERHVDILASIMALYPFTPTEDLTFEFGLQPNKISYVASALGVLKSKEERDAAREYLQNQGLQLMERRGGAQSNHFMSPVEKVARNGRVIATYDSVTEAAEANESTPTTIRKYCNGAKNGYDNDGYKYRYKKTKEKI